MRRSKAIREASRARKHYDDQLAWLLEATPFPLSIWPLIIAAPFIIYWTEKLRVLVVERYARVGR